MSSYSKRACALIAMLGDRPVAYHPKLARPLGGPMEVIFVCQLLYWDGKGQMPGGWIYKTQGEWESETGLTRRNQETVRKHLKELGVIEEKLSGMPARLFYRINFARLIPLIEAAYAEGDPDFLAPTESEPPVCTDQPNKDGGTSQTSMAESAELDCTNPPDMIGETSQRSEITTETSSREYAEKGPPASPPVPVASFSPPPDLWPQCLAELEQCMTRATFDQWLKGSRLILYDPNEKRAEIGLPNDYAADWCRQRLGTAIRRILEGVSGVGELQIEYRADGTGDEGESGLPAPPPGQARPTPSPPQRMPRIRHADTPDGQAELADLRRQCVAAGLSEQAAAGKGKRWLKDWLDTRMGAVA